MDNDTIIKKYVVLLSQQTYNCVVLESEYERLLKENEELRKKIEEIKEKKNDGSDKK